ncbi:MAG: molybdate ABC transporter substrate-binding protein [Planctomycetales bacterium]|nr:molybdate ABC transporter substrate-binding protein [Planctomycetales bacterium]
MIRRPGNADWLAVWTWASLATLLVLGWSLHRQREQALSVSCAASLRLPLEKIAARYRAEHGVAVHLQFGGSQTLLSQIEAAPGADLYLPADQSYATLAQRKKLADAATPLAEMQAVILVAAGNPKEIHSWRDLLRDDVRVALGNPDQAAIGAAVREALAAEGNWMSLEQAIRARGVLKPTVSDAAMDAALGAADAAIVWDVVARQYPQLETVRDAWLAERVRGRIVASVLTQAARPAAAKRFVEYLASPTGGQPVFQEFGFQQLSNASSAAQQGVP